MNEELQVDYCKNFFLLYFNSLCILKVKRETLSLSRQTNLNKTNEIYYGHKLQVILHQTKWNTFEVCVIFYLDRPKAQVIRMVVKFATVATATATTKTVRVKHFEWRFGIFCVGSPSQQPIWNH